MGAEDREPDPVPGRPAEPLRLSTAPEVLIMMRRRRGRAPLEGQLPGEGKRKRAGSSEAPSRGRTGPPAGAARERRGPPRHRGGGVESHGSVPSGFESSSGCAGCRWAAKAGHARSRFAPGCGLTRQSGRGSRGLRPAPPAWRGTAERPVGSAEVAVDLLLPARPCRPSAWLESPLPPLLRARGGKRVTRSRGPADLGDALGLLVAGRGDLATSAPTWVTDDKIRLSVPAVLADLRPRRTLAMEPSMRSVVSLAALALAREVADLLGDHQRGRRLARPPPR